VKARFGVVSASVLAAVGLAVPAHAAPTTTITVDFTAPVAASPPENFGLTFSTFGVDGGPTANNAADIAALQALDPGAIRVHLKPLTDGRIVTGAADGDQTISGDRWIDVIEEIGAEPVVIVNVNAAEAVAVLNYLNANGHQVKKFIVGNEMDSNSGADMTAAEYTAAFRQIARAMRQVTPDLKIGGPAPAHFATDVLQTFVAGAVTNAPAAEKASFVDYHAYGAGAGANATIAQSTQYTAQLQQLRTMVGDASVGLQVGEYNMNWGDESQNNTHFASVWVANALGRIISEGATALLYADKNNAMGLIGPNGAPKASYLGMAMFTGQPGGLRHFGTQVVRSTSSDAAVHVYASTNEKNVVVVNTGTDTTATLNLTGVTTGTADLWQSAGAIAQLHPPVKTGTAAIAGGTLTAALPGMSITTFVVNGATSGGTSTLPAFDNAGWQRAGTGATTATTATLTTVAQQFSAGSVYHAAAVPSAALDATFDATIGGGTGGDGMTFALLDPASTARVGGTGGGLGYSGLTGVAVTLDTFNNATNAAQSLIGVATAASGTTFTYAGSTTAVPALRATHRYQVKREGGNLVVSVDGTVVLRAAVTLPANVVVAFTAGTGNATDLHQVTSPTIRY
jgi:Glycosyl hydrolases family 39